MTAVRSAERFRRPGRCGGRRLALSVAVGVALCGAMPGRAVAQALLREHVTVELASALDAIVPGGKWLMALRLVSEPGWHTYWKNPGDAGTATALRWALPPGFRAGPILWPPPRRIAEGSLAVYGYEGEVLLLVEVEAPRDLRPGQPATLAAHADWVVCREICLQGAADLSRRVAVADSEPVISRRWRGPLRAARAGLPPLLHEWRVSADRAGGGYLLRIVPPQRWTRPLGDVQFFAADAGVIDHAAPQRLTREGDGYRLALTASRYAATRPARLAGLLVAPAGWQADGAVPVVEVDVPIGRR
jgi:DsbC/DsbD-like thiol-disulfide interchange protein